MFDQIHKTEPGAGGEALYFVVQLFVATIGVLIACYPVMLDVEIWLRPSSEALVHLWRWVGLLLPVFVGFAVGFGVVKLLPRAYYSGRFVWIIPLAWFFYMFARTLAVFPFARAIDVYLVDAGEIEMTIGPCFYAIGSLCAHRGIQKTALTMPESNSVKSEFPRPNPFC